MAMTGGRQRTEDERELRRAALAVLRRNRRTARDPVTGRQYRYTCPSPGHYPFQWFWDSAFHSIALARLEPEVAREELLLLVAGQDTDGFMPHVRFWERRRLLHPALYWCWLQSRGAHLPVATALAQPPVVAAAVERYGALTGDLDLVRRLLPSLESLFRWLARARDPDGDGILTLIAPWESGMDHRPSYDEALGLRYPARPRDLVVRPRLLDIANRAAGYRSTLVQHGRFRVDDILFNAVYADGMRAIARLRRHVSGAAGETSALRWDTAAERTERALIARLRGGTGFFHDMDARTGRLLPGETVAGLCALLLASLDEAGARPLLRALADPGRFGTPFSVPSVSARDPAFVPDELRWGAGPLLWRGPVWINTNWLLVRALRRRGEDAVARRIARASAELVRRSGFREYYNPYTGAGYGARSFGWSTLVVDLMDV